MTHKDLAGEYLTKAQENAIYFKDGKFPNMPLYQENDIKAAFNAGRESVVESAMESIPEFKWRGVCHPDGDFVAAYPNDCRYLIEFIRSKHDLFYNRQFIASFASLSQAKQAANEDYKKRIKQALGL